jgi:gamma-glutamyl-gamma-aminobutyrate hydrolase PuuD
MTRILVNTWRREGEVFGPVLRDMLGVEVQYAQSLQRAGAQVYLTPQAPPGTDPAEIVRGFDGLLVIGGEDLAAEVSGAAPQDIGEGASAGRDRWEIALLRAALADDIPVLGICRGMQLLNAAFGGSLHGDIAGISPQHPHVPADRDQALSFRHRVTFEPGSLVSRAYGAAAKEANSLHHQAVDRVGSGLTVSGRATDGTVEALELPGARWCLGVQWHPELLPDDPQEFGLFAEFVRACTDRLGLAVGPASAGSGSGSLLWPLR